ncbi:MAG TPA: hypothetical protein VN519_07265 [Bryobacteraceae bacterium]|nr:hypothetical protein [Bryobacteraceae bacterium]
MRRWILLFVAVLGLTFSAFGDEAVAGTWKGTFDTPNGAQENTFVLKVDGDKLTGSITGMMGTIEISNGKVDGDKVSFAINTDFGLISYRGTVKGDDMNLTLSAGEGQFKLDFVAHRAKS